MRVVVVGASGNAGTALLRRLHREPAIDLVGVVRRPPDRAAGPPYESVDWHALDIGLPGAADALTEIFRRADVVVHLAWQIQPSHDVRLLRRTNVNGSRAVFDAVARARVPALVYASSVGAYAAGPKEPVDERWPATGIGGSSYSRHKAIVESMLDRLQEVHPTLRVVRIRPALIFQRDAGTEIARYFLGPLVPVPLLRFGRLPVVPTANGLCAQAVHADDLAEAYARAILGRASGPFNIAAEPVLTPPLMAEEFGGRPVHLPGPLLWLGASATWHARLQPADAGWVAMALRAPLMSAERAARELDWKPSVDAVSALRELLAGIAERAHTGSPPLSDRPWLPGRFRGLLLGRLPGQGNPY